MLREFEVNGSKFYLDPETNFWAIGDKEEVESFWLERREWLREEMRRYRFEVDLKTTYINPTEKCNRDCPYCYIPKQIKQRGKTMIYDQIEDIMNCLAENGVERVIFHGAEPLIVKNLIFRAIEEFNFAFGIQTNATLLEEDDANFLIEKGVSIGISLDSPYRKVNDSLRGEGHYDAVMRALEWFEGYRNINVIMTINRHNYRHVADMVEFLAGRVEVLLANPVRGTSEGGRMLRPPEGFERYYIEAIDKAMAMERRVVIGDFANVLLGLVAPTSRVLQCDISPCGGGRRFFAISPAGIYPCGEFIGLEEFRLDFSSLKNWEILDSFTGVRQRTVEKIGECRDCEFRNLCGAPCPAEVYAEKGSLLEKSPYCEFYKALAKKAIEVIVREEVEKVLRLKKLRRVY